MMIDVGAPDEFPEGVMRITDLGGGREVGVVRWRGEFHALRNICPHLSAPVCRGTLSSPLGAGDEPWQPQRDPTRLVMCCPWHRWEFDVATGRSMLGKYAVKKYSVQVRDGRVFVEFGRPASMVS